MDIVKEVKQYAMKSLFNFYLDSEDKTLATEKLERLVGKKNKGLLASFLRTQIKLFNAMPDDKVSKTMLEYIDNEYEVTQTLNKRSRL